MGAYGRRIDSELDPDTLAIIGGESWPVLEVSFAFDPEPGSEDIVMRQGPGGPVCLDASGTRAVVPRIPDMPVSELVHPGLTAAAWLAARLQGEEVMHAGAYVVEDGAWIVIGDHEHGKSTLLGLLFSMGSEILADDMIVIRDGRACAGPRCLDLRAEAAGRLEIGTPARLGYKHRVGLPPIAAELPIHGFVHLDWADDLSLRRLRPGERMSRLLAHTGQPPRRRPSEMLELSELPHLLLSRPRDWDMAVRSAEMARDIMSGSRATA